jgi:hypothetical protein
MLNKLAETEVGDGLINSMVSALMKQMEGGYRLAFPVVKGHRRILRCVALLAPASDRRLKAIRQLQVTPGATHVVVFLAFESEPQWLEQANQMTRLFPEQPGKPELVIAE